MEILELDRLKNRDWQLFKISALKNAGDTKQVEIKEVS